MSRDYKVGPLPVVNGVVTSISTVVTPVAHFTRPFVGVIVTPCKPYCHVLVLLRQNPCPASESLPYLFVYSSQRGISHGFAENS